MPASLALALLALGGTKSFDWVTTGRDCALFACGDLDGDGFDDVLTINGARQLCVAYSVRGFKAAPWKSILEPAPEGALELRVAKGEVLVRTATSTFVYRFDGEKLVESPGSSELPAPAHAEDLAVSAPPYEEPDPGRRPLAVFHGDLNGDGLADTLALFEASRPHPHRVVRASLALDPGSGDRDSDGLTDEEERRLGTDPEDRDTDGDGLLDGWEVHGLPRGVEGPEDALDPRHQDFIVQVSVYEPLVLDAVQKEVARSKRLFAQMKTANPDGTSGIRLHFRWLPLVPKSEQGSWSWAETGNRVIPDACRGLMHWMQVTPGGGGQSVELGDMGGSGNHWAAFAHELGHQLGLSHTGDSQPAWCPLYTSLMNYAFNYSFDGDGEKIHFSDGRFRKVELRETALDEHLDFPYAELAYLAKGPFHFQVEDDLSGGTWVDWNHNGLHDMAAAVADVNYGGSTSCGIRRDVERVAAAPALVRVGDTIFLVTVDLAASATSIRTWLGGEKWSEPRAVPDSATSADPVAVGGSERGCVLIKAASGWRAARFDARAIDAPQEIGGEDDLSAAAIDGRTLLVDRGADGCLSSRWLEFGEHGASTAVGPKIEFRSDVEVGIAQEKPGGRVVLVGSGENADGKPSCMKVAWFEIDAGGAWRKVEQRTVGGDHDTVHCTTRPTVRFLPDGQLAIFHTGWPDANGERTAWRTTMLPTRTLRDGWLVCLLYDEWTRTQKAVAWEIGPQGAVYAYRWDAAGEKQRLQTAFNGLGIDAEPMRDFDDCTLVSKWGIRESILNLRR